MCCGGLRVPCVVVVWGDALNELMTNQSTSFCRWSFNLLWGTGYIDFTLPSTTSIICSEQCKADMPTGTQTETPEKSISISPTYSPQTSPVAPQVSPIAPQFSPVAPHTSAVALQTSPIAPHFSLVAPQLSPADISENNSQSQSEITQQCVILIPRPLWNS